MSDADDADDATMPDTRASAPSATGIRSTELGDRYEVAELLGRGGMGEVRLARDKKFDRAVAVKLMLETTVDDATLGRFFREARVQGVLDHPAVVPVHDLGIDEHGNPYFVMKRLEGITLADVLMSSDPALREKWPRRKLLPRLVDICLAIQFAHERDVIHRDLKPANLMLGEHGEAYVLDWGLARMVGDRKIEGDVASPSGANGDETRAGDLLGTPGYMSPEQARGEQVDGRTDVFSLGCVLYEILAGRPALARGIAGIQETLDVVELRPSAKSPDVPLELDDLCAEATAGDRAKRPTAGALGDRIQAYLDGDRDEVRRRELGAAMARDARLALDRAIVRDARPEVTHQARAEAIRHASRALVLDPSNSTALDVMSYLLREQPAEIPAEALAAADHERAVTRQKVLHWSRTAVVALIGIELALLFVPIHHVWPVVGMLVFSIASLINIHLMTKKLLPMRSLHYLTFIALTSAALMCAGIVLGPLFILPLIVIGAIGAFVAQPVAYPAWVIAAPLVIPIGILVLLESIGVLPSTFAFRDGSFVLTTWVFDLTPTIAVVLLASSLVVQIFNSMVVAVFQKRAQQAAQNQIHAHQWHLEKLLPDGSRKPR
ncbi:MAG: protein kinase [Deltaproteobacteria bacterium]|nr:protein kinase [Deltaproteobacteria bacterium]